jgi:hypothetical protein
MKTMTQPQTTTNSWEIIQSYLVTKIQDETIGGKQN